MIREVRDSTEGLDPDNNIFTRAGVKMLHPEPYSGEANLERFEVFVAALLQWLLLNLLLGSDHASTLMQVRYLGNCLKGDAQEWYVQNVEHHNRVVHEWTLESALIEMQKHFLHSLMHRYVSTTYETTHQGSEWHCSGSPEQTEQTNHVYGPETRQLYTTEAVLGGST